MAKKHAFKVGDAVVHPHRGAGIVRSKRTINIVGEERRVYVIELVNGRGMLMVPISEVDVIGLRAAEYGEKDIKRILIDAPEELADHYRARHADAKRKVDGGNPLELAQVIRDLSWRSRQTELTQRDSELLQLAKKRLVGELAALNGTTIGAAGRQLNEMIQEAMLAHREEARAA